MISLSEILHTIAQALMIPCLIKRGLRRERCTAVGQQHRHPAGADEDRR